MNKNIIADTLMNYNKQGVLALSLGDYEKALECFKKSYYIESEIKLSQEKGKTLINIANTMMLLNKPEQALETADEALDIFKQLNYKQDYLLTLLLIANIQIHLKNFKQSETILLKMLKETLQNNVKGEIYLSLHEVYLKNKENYQAQESITKAIQYFDSSQEKNKLTQTLLTRADFFKTINRADLAAMDLNKVDYLSNEVTL